MVKNNFVNILFRTFQYLKLKGCVRVAGLNDYLTERSIMAIARLPKLVEVNIKGLDVHSSSLHYLNHLQKVVT